jgi:cysteine desulfurase/selenocysteine lyase
MLGPTGIGVLYGKKHILEEMEPFQGGGEMIKEVSFNPKTRRCSMTWNSLPWKFEAGTPNASGGVGFMEAARYLKRIGIENVQAYEEKLTKHAIRRLQELRKVTIYGPKETSAKCGIIPFSIGGLSSHDVALFLDSYGVMVRSGFHCAQPLHQVFRIKSSARASFYIYNTIEEIDRFVDVLEELGDT